MNIFKQEFKMKIKSIIIWSLSLAGFIISYMAFFPTMAKDSIALDSITVNFPKEMLQALGLREGLSISSLVGYFTLTFTLIQLAIAIQSANYGFAILTEEERELTADFLMTKPISRRKVYFGKFIAAFLSLIITGIVLAVGCFIALELFNAGQSYETINVVKLLITVPIFQSIFLSLGMIISLSFKKLRSVLSLSMGLAIGLYVINSVRGIVDSNILGLITPYYYFEPGVILKSGEYDWRLLLLGLGIIAISLVSSFVVYNKRDIHSL